ncbi:MAG: CotH kinase family protein [Bacteroidia bacterium]
MPSTILKISLFALLAGLSGLLNAQVVVNEYSGANRNGIVDDFGDNSDWIELYNAGGAAVDISGYFLSDKETNPTKYQIPAGTVLNANSYRIFFASGRDINAGINLHTNFKITQTGGDFVVFADQGGTILESYPVTPTRVNHSRGRNPNGGATWQIFSAPSPGVANGVGFDAYTETPTFSILAGIYGTAQSVTITSATAGSTIRYTIDGSEPSVTSTAYAGPINIATSTAIKARAFPAANNLLAGFTETNTYFININHTLPIVSLVSDQYDDLFANGFGDIVSNIEYFTSGGTQQFESYGEVDRHGNDSWAFAQKGVDFIVRDQYGYDDEIDYQIFPTSPRTKFQRIMFKAGASDNYPFTWGSGGGCHLRDVFIQTLAESAGMNVDLRRNDHCAVYINGEYWGLYEVREKVNDPDYTDYYWDQKEEDLDMLSFWGGLDVRFGSAADWNNLYTTIMSTDLSVQANYNQISTRLDIASVIDYIIINSWSVNSDWMNWNTMWWRGRGTPNVKWKYALWDMDNVFNLGQNFSGWPTTNFNADPCGLDDNFENAGPNEGHLDIFNRLMANEEFKARYINRYAEMINTFLDCSYALAHFDNIVNHISPEMPQQIARWGGSMAEWQSHLDFMRNQIIGRCEYIEENGLVNCYPIDGPHALAFNVEPAGAGTIRFNELQVPEYPWSGSYYGGVQGEIEATANALYEFDYWEVFTSVLNSVETEALNTFMITTADSIVAHFKVIETHEITFLVDPPGSGNISINGVTPGSYPFTTTLNEGDPITMTSTPTTNYEFVDYTSTYHAFTPDPAQMTVYLEADTSDTLIAHFVPTQMWDLVLMVEPEEAGKIWLNGEWVQQYPRTFTFFPGDVASSDVLASEEYDFAYWSLNHLNLAADSSEFLNGCVVDSSDTLTAHFILKEVIPQTMYVPSSFTPNGDDLNDFFECYHTETITEGSIVIFNRWGEEVFNSGSLGFAWDGKKNNQLMPEGVYYYMLTYFLKDKYSEVVQGKILLLR